MLPVSVMLPLLSLGFHVVLAMLRDHAMITGPHVTAFTATAVHAVPVWGSSVSCRHAHCQFDVVSTTVGDATVLLPDLSCTAIVRVPASLLIAYARVVTAYVVSGVDAMAAIP